MQGISHGTVFHSVAADNIEQRTALTVRHIVETHLLLAAGDSCMVILKLWQQLADEGLSLLVYQFALLCHLFLPDVEQCAVWFFFHLQKGVALLQCLVISRQRL